MRKICWGVCEERDLMTSLGTLRVIFWDFFYLDGSAIRILPLFSQGTITKPFNTTQQKMTKIHYSYYITASLSLESFIPIIPTNFVHFSITTAQQLPQPTTHNPQPRISQRWRSIALPFTNEKTMKKSTVTISKSLSLLFDLPTIDLIDRLDVMLSQEDQPQYIAKDYLHSRSKQHSRDLLSRSKSKQVNPASRAKIVRWLYDIVDYFHLERSTVAMAMSYVDRFMSTPSARASRKNITSYQLTCLACLFVAIKVLDVTHLDIDLLVKASRGCYERQEILDMEKEVLDALGWRVCDATSSCIANHLLGLLTKVVPMDTTVVESLVDFTRLQIELSVAEYDICVLRRPSNVALAAVLNSMELLDFASKQKAVYHRVIGSIGLSLSSSRLRDTSNELNELFDRQSEYITSRFESSAVSVAQQQDCEPNTTRLPLPSKNGPRCEPSPTCVGKVPVSEYRQRIRSGTERGRR